MNRRNSFALTFALSACWLFLGLRAEACGAGTECTGTPHSLRNWMPAPANGLGGLVKPKRRRCYIID